MPLERRRRARTPPRCRRAGRGRTRPDRRDDLVHATVIRPGPRVRARVAHASASAALSRTIASTGVGSKPRAGSRGSTLDEVPGQDQREQLRRAGTPPPPRSLPPRSRPTRRCRSTAGTAARSRDARRCSRRAIRTKPVAGARHPAHDLVVIELRAAPTSKAGTFPFSFIWVFQRIAATAPTPCAPQITGTRSPIQRASSLAGCPRRRASGADAARPGPRAPGRSPRRRLPASGAVPSPRAPEQSEGQMADRRARLESRRQRHDGASPSSAARAASVPPLVMASDTRAPDDGLFEARRGSRPCLPNTTSTPPASVARRTREAPGRGSSRTAS